MQTNIFQGLTKINDDEFAVLYNKSNSLKDSYSIIRKYNTNGEMLKESSFNNLDVSRLISMYSSKDKGFILSGYTFSTSLDGFDSSVDHQGIIS